MEIKAMKCPNCGAKLNIKPDESGMATCKYCRESFSVETTYSKAYDSTKGMLDAQRESFNEALDSPVMKRFNTGKKIFFIIFGIAFLFVITIIISASINMEKDRFNNKYEMHSGTVDAFFIPSIFDEVVKNNQTSKRKVELCLDEICSSDVKEIISLKDNIKDNTEYEVILSYKKGYVNKIDILTKVKKV